MTTATTNTTAAIKELMRQRQAGYFTMEVADDAIESASLITWGGDDLTRAEQDNLEDWFTEVLEEAEELNPSSFYTADLKETGELRIKVQQQVYVSTGDFTV